MACKGTASAPKTFAYLRLEEQTHSMSQRKDVAGWRRWGGGRPRSGNEGRPVMGIAIWTGLLAAFFGYQGFCLAAANNRWPPITDIFRAIISYPIGRSVLFALWLWLGWHLFVRTLSYPYRG